MEKTGAAARDELIQRLRRELRGEVLDDPVSLGLYATDASPFQITPLVVALPLDRADALRAVRIAGELGAPILPRGGGTSLSGQTVAPAVVIDFSRHMNRVLELDVAERWARVEPGVVRDELNAQLRTHRLHFAPDPASSSRANIGGMIGNNAAGMRSIRYGMTIDHVLALDLALSTGEVLNLAETDAATYETKCRLRDREGDIYRGFRELIDQNRDHIRARYPKVRRRSGGYPFDAFLSPLPWNMAKIICSSEGTLGVALEAKIRLEPLPRHAGLCVAHFRTSDASLRAVAGIVAHAPSAVELLDGLIVRLARENYLTRNRCGFIEGEPGAVLIIESQDDDAALVAQSLRAIAETAQREGAAYAAPVMIDAAAQRDVWLMRASGLGLMTTVKGARKPIPFIEDAAVPVEVLPQYIEEVRAICARHGRPVSIFAHASVGLIHVRPMLDLHEPGEIAVLKSIQEEVFQRVVHYGGAWSGEHGDGIIRGGFNERFFGPRLYDAFRRLKQLFDPPGLMNPGKVIDTPPIERHLRYMPGYRMHLPGAMFRYEEDNGIQHAVEKCTGIGDCRKTLGGTMCPSYIATRDEEHSTRGRANALRLAMTGQLGPDGLATDRIRDVLDLCLACKGCKQECPNNVDMARLKAEVLHHRHKRNGAAWREKLFADPARLGRLFAGPAAPLVNALLASPFSRAAMELLAGIDRRRCLPRYANRRLSDSMLELRTPTPEQSPPRPPVVLFNDTYMEYHEPSIGRAAIESLEAAGCAVRLATVGCCQRPAISAGFLDAARLAGGETLRRLDDLSRDGLPILVCEPSCATALKDDLPDLVEDAHLARRVADRVMLIEDYLALRLDSGDLQFPPANTDSLIGPQNPQSAILNPKYMVHGHCHQKALFRVDAGMQLLRSIPNADVRLIDAGCCGMAGAFGYQKEHYDISLKVGEDRLFPALRAADPETIFVANGFSCRHQIRDVTGRPARHLVEALAETFSAADHTLP